MIGDLHCHSKLSDGATSLEDIVFYAKRSGLDFLSITDHDTMSGVSRAEILGKRYGIIVIPGVEISSFDPDTGRKVHVLCYLPHKPDRLAGLLMRTLDERRRAGEEMIHKVMHYFPITEEHVNRYSANSKSIYKVHIMQALLDLGYDNQIYGDLYRTLFRDGSGSCLVSVKYPTVEEVLGEINAAGGVAVIAHPSHYRSVELVKKLASAGLIQGVEAHHPRNTKEDTEELLSVAKEYSLVATGGTDFHGFYAAKRANPMGTCVTEEEEIKRLYAFAKSLE